MLNKLNISVPKDVEGSLTDYLTGVSWQVFHAHKPHSKPYPPRQLSQPPPNWAVSIEKTPSQISEGKGIGSPGVCHRIRHYPVDVISSAGRAFPPILWASRPAGRRLPRLQLHHFDWSLLKGYIISL